MSSSGEAERGEENASSPLLKSTNNDSMEFDSMEGRPLFAIEDALKFMTLAAQSLSQCFEPKPLRNDQPEGILYLVWACGVLIRYGVLLPFRLGFLLFVFVVFVLAMAVAHAAGNDEWKRGAFSLGCKAWLFTYGAIVRHHGRKPKLPAHHPHLFVANHTSFNDFLILSSHRFPHGVLAQNHGGVFGLLMKHLLEAYGSLSFNRNEQKDRIKVAGKIREHIADPHQFAPLLIFPEGTCVNNESTVLFHKGAFDLGCTICPVAVKYNKRLSDPYWNTREQTFSQHVIYLMTRWMMIVDVWWLEPQDRLPGESDVQFAERIKAMISEAAGLKNKSWDGYLKNVMRAMDREKMQRKSQCKYADYLKTSNRLVKSSGTASKAASSTESLLAAAQEPSASESDESAQAIPIKSRRSWSGPATLGRSMPTGRVGHDFTSQHPEFPPWLNDASLVDVKNSLLMDDGEHIGERLKSFKGDVASAWRLYAKRKPSIDSALGSNNRMENGSWRSWYRQMKSGEGGGSGDTPEPKEQSPENN